MEDGLVGGDVGDGDDADLGDGRGCDRGGGLLEEWEGDGTDFAFGSDFFELGA